MGALYLNNQDRGCSRIEKLLRDCCTSPMEKLGSDGLESTWLGRTHFSRSICYRLDSSSAIPQLSFPLANDLRKDLQFRKIPECHEKTSQITHKMLPNGKPNICATFDLPNSTSIARPARHSRSHSLPSRTVAGNDDSCDSEDYEDAVCNREEMKNDDHSNVSRATSWSEYFTTSGDEYAVEEAEDWMVDLSELFLGPKFASGAYSRLHLGKYKDAAVAVKILRKPDDNEEIARRLERQFRSEVNVLSRAHHGNIVKFLGACRKPPVCCIITEYLSLGSVRAYLRNQEPFSLPLPSVISMALDVARGMDYLHSLGVIHRDLKSENLVVADDLHVKITDFGLACFESEMPSMTKDVGTYRWMAPEMISNKRFSKKVDVYSFGIVLWELLTGRIPFEELSPVQAAFAIVHKHARPPLPLDCPNALGYLMHQCWSTDADKRPDFSEVVESLEELLELSRLGRSMSTWERRQKHTSAFLRCFVGCV